MSIIFSSRLGAHSSVGAMDLKGSGTIVGIKLNFLSVLSSALPCQLLLQGHCVSRILSLKMPLLIHVPFLLTLGFSGIIFVW